MHIKSVLNKDKSHYYYNIFLEKRSYQLVKICHSIIMVKFGKTEIAKKKKVLCCKKICKNLGC